MIFWLLLALVAFIGVEIFLNLACLVSPRVSALLSARGGLEIQDKKLGFRPNPAFFDHDAGGFRNKSVPQRADVVVLGDSMSYGTWVRREEAWPQRLQALARIDAYNMAYSGYCPVTSLLMLDEALELRPTLVIEALYGGNDFYESYAFVYREGKAPEFKTTDNSRLEALDKQDSEDSIADRSLALFEPRRGLKEFLGRYCRTYGLLWLAKAVFVPDHTWPWFWLKFRAGGFPGWVPMEFDGFRTILSPDYRLLGLNLDDARIREGLLITLKCLRTINERLLERKVKFLVLYLPTKELVVEELLKDKTSRNSRSCQVLVENEKAALHVLEGFCRDQRISFVDATLALTASIREGKQPFLINHDAHPSAAGHNVIASVILEEIQRAGLVEDRTGEK